MSGGLCRLPLKAWGLLCAVEAGDHEVAEAERHARGAALECIACAVGKLQTEVAGGVFPDPYHMTVS